MDFTNVYHKFLRLDKWVSEKVSLYERKLIHCYRMRFLYAGKLGIQFTSGLPKTRSGKIMRRILRKIAEGDTESMGDTSTLADPAVVESLVSGRIK